jgi:Lrp/AsnC family leucine-responsive transcriptional regulator
MRITTTGALCAALGEEIEGFPEVLECHRVTGEEAYLAKVAVRSVAHLQDLIDRLMPYGETITSIVLSSPVRHRVIDRQDQAATAETRA